MNYCGYSDNHKKMAKPLKYNKTLYIRVTDELFDRVNKNAKKLKIPPTIYVRNLIEKELFSQLTTTKKPSQSIKNLWLTIIKKQYGKKIQKQYLQAKELHNRVENLDNRVDEIVKKAKNLEKKLKEEKLQKPIENIEELYKTLRN